MPRKLTDEDLAGPQFENTMHMNLGGGSYGYGYTSTKFPRIGFRNYTYRGARAKKEGCSRRRVWTLDGVPVESKQAAMDGHAIAPVPTEDEAKVLALVPEDWQPYRETSREIDKALGLPEREEGMAAYSYRHLSALRDKDLVQTMSVETEPTEFTTKLGLAHLNRKTMIRRTPADAIPE